MQTTDTPPDPRLARLAGGLYLSLAILAGWAEFGLRAGVLVPGDAQATASAILADPGRFRLAFLADTFAAALDAALVVPIFLLFRAAGPGLGAVAAIFRLMHSALMAGALMFHLGAVLVLQGQGMAAAPMALTLTELHANGYDLGLVFFGIHLILLAVLVRHSPWMPRVFAPLLAAGGAVYVAGSTIRFLAPDLLGAFQPAYTLPALAEIGFALWLLFRGTGGSAAVPA